MPLVELTLKDGTRVLGELKGEEVIPYSQTPEFPEGKTRVRLKVGNRDLYGLDFRWVDTDRIATADSPNDVAMRLNGENGVIFTAGFERSRAAKTSSPRAIRKDGRRCSR